MEKSKDFQGSKKQWGRFNLGMIARKDRHENRGCFSRLVRAVVGLMLTVVIIVVGVPLAINAFVCASTRPEFSSVSSPDIQQNTFGADAIVVLGAGINWDGSPSAVLKDRLDTAIALYNEGVATKIIMSGDHGQEDYDEVNVMKSYAIDEGINSSDIFMDHAGFSTYDSIYRLKEIFEVDKVVIVTQEYHLYRALYIAKELEIEAYGVSANLRDYPGQFKREVREILARDKDLVKVIFKPSSTYVGETIPVTGDGNITNDK